MKFVKPKEKQPDSKSCGVFAIAYATCILFGMDPAEYNPKLNPAHGDHSMNLRRHLADMLRNNRLQLFPSQ